jgi:hypothetical protein
MVFVPSASFALDNLPQAFNMSGMSTSFGVSRGGRGVTEEVHPPRFQFPAVGPRVLQPAVNPLSRWPTPLSPARPIPKPLSAPASHHLRRRGKPPWGKLRLKRAGVGLLVLLTAVAGLPPPSPAQEPAPLQASARDEYSTALSELPESLKSEWIEQKRLLLDSFAQQVIDVREDNRSSLRDMKENAAAARRQALENYHEEGTKLREEHAEDLQRSAANLSPERYQRKREDLLEDLQDDIEDLRIDQEELAGEIRRDFEEEADELAGDLEQSLFEIQREQEYAIAQLEAERREAMLQHYQRQLEMEALRTIMSDLTTRSLEGPVLFEILGYLQDRVSIEVTLMDLAHSRVRMEVTMNSDFTTIKQAMELFGLSEGQKAPDGAPPPATAPPEADR